MGQIKANLNTDQSRKMADLALRLDKVFVRLFHMKLEGTLEVDKYNSLLLSCFGRIEAYREELDSLWELFVDLKNENSLRISFKNGKKRKFQKRKSRPFNTKTNLGEDFLRLAMSMDNIQTLLVKLVLARIVPEAKSQHVISIFNAQIKNLREEIDALERVENNVAKAG
ncbi:hypothetical protein [Pseudodesulfovibrio pelocollis]|uniref:hypothetical protein n=1 Tax=Pseudodesulfovibrio pelocollis TaxID=3051432 RepID=UPI00255B3D39|nr:hypothetical protein [Pseudodesulfovibrio sp. SB368]